jgi:hypothetical protein
MHNNVSETSTCAVFPEKNHLPGAQKQLTSAKKNLLRCTGQRALDVGRHIIRTFHGLSNRFQEPAFRKNIPDPIEHPDQRFPE